MTTDISEMEAIQRQKCSSCKMNMTLDKFKKKRDDTYQKTCDECLQKRKVYANKNKCEHGLQKCVCGKCGGASSCEHGRRRSQCIDCGGSQICEHNKRRSNCVDCDGSAMCEHDIQRSYCKVCSDPLKITIKNMIKHSKKTDKKHDRYDPVNFVDYCFLENLLEDYSHCCYPDCNVGLQITEYQDDLATIERLDNSIGHIKSNCVICCLKCNRVRKSDR